MVFHGHAHHGTREGKTPGGVPVLNVAMPLPGEDHAGAAFRAGRSLSQGGRSSKVPGAMDFFQDPPRLANQYDADHILRSWVERTLPEPMRKAVEPELREMGELAATTLLNLSMRGRRDEPQLVPYNPWGRRIDEIRVPEAWRAFARVATEWAGGHPAPAEARRLLPHPSGRAGPPLRALELHLHLPAGDDRRRGARRCSTHGERGADRARRARG